MRKILKIVAGFVILGACEKTVDFELPDPGDKITIDARLEQGEQAEALVSSSVDALSSENPDRSDKFSVKLLENGQLVAQFQHSPSNLTDVNYQSAYEIQSGKTYTVKATSSGLPDAQGTDGVPETIQVKDWEFNEATQDLRLQLPGFKQDAGGYYVLRASLESLVKNPVRRVSSSQVTLSSVDPQVEFFNTQDINDPSRPSGSRAIINAQSEGRGEFSVTMRMEEDPFATDTAAVDSLYYHLQWQHWTEDQYQFNRRDRLSDLSGDGPFGEPVQPYFNVEGGYGIVAGFTPSSDTLLLKP